MNAGFSGYEKGGVVTQVKMPKTLSFKSLAEGINDPEMIITDYAKMDFPAQLHLGFRALDFFIERNSRLPRPWNLDDSQALFWLAQEINEGDEHGSKVETIDEKLIKVFASVSAGNVCPMNGFLGGVVAQEVMKACSGKFHPIKQWLYFDAIECLPQFKGEQETAVDEVWHFRS
jgi:ubiquitin-activating enzyme E1